jgi:hypothetical protein
LENKGREREGWDGGQEKKEFGSGRTEGEELIEGGESARMSRRARESQTLQNNNVRSRKGCIGRQKRNLLRGKRQADTLGIKELDAIQANVVQIAVRRCEGYRERELICLQRRLIT